MAGVVHGLGLGVWGLGLGVWGSWVGIGGLWFGVWGEGLVLVAALHAITTVPGIDREKLRGAGAGNAGEQKAEAKHGDP